MKNVGDPEFRRMPAEPLYIAARRILLKALEALGEQCQAVILVGAQAIYLQVGEADLAIPPFTKDADIVLDPGKLKSTPLLEAAMKGAGFKPGRQPGEWLATTTAEGPVDIPVDLMVPDSMGGPGRRGARLNVHGNKAARKARGLEAVLLDHKIMQIGSLEKNDVRNYSVAVAGPASLLIAKLHKIGERIEHPDRTNAKDSFDVFRILRGVSTEALSDSVRRLLNDQFSREVTQQALYYLEKLFVNKQGIGLQLAATAVARLMSEEEVKESFAALAQDLFKAIQKA